MQDTVLLKKAKQARMIFNDLCEKFDVKQIPTSFVADPAREKQFKSAMLSANPFNFPLSLVLLQKRIPAVKKLFEEEKILQTPAIAAVLAACSSVASEISDLRGDGKAGAQCYCDIAFAGMEAIRLFMADHSGAEFVKQRIKSATMVNNAWNGSFYKYRAKDGRDVSFHVYYQSQQKKLVGALPMKKASEDYNFFSMPFDKKELRDIISKYSADELEELAFDCGACGCKIRSREEWEETEVGKAVINMPLVNVAREGKASKKPKWGKSGFRGPLSGIKVLDLTHIIAGPACSRILAEMGADVLLVRRGRFTEQEQAMLEFDGWAGKNSIQLDFNKPDELARCKELIKEADVITYSYQNGTLDRFGLSESDIRELNPNVIYSNLMCFSDTVWKQRPGWAPCAEDITGLSVRNGTLEKPVNLNGVPLDYFPGFILAFGTLLAIAKKLKNGGGYKVTTSLTRGAQYLHEVTDLCDGKELGGNEGIIERIEQPMWDSLIKYSSDTSVGVAGFPGPAVINTAFKYRYENLHFRDGNKGFSEQ